ncbi:MAG: hypothetical protein M3O50_14540 [Myxococcota bacterium]|nr:hypothetical protein [Myxococcota bacterium]
MRRGRITVAHSAGTALLVGALGACGSGDSSNTGVIAAADAAGVDAPANDSTAIVPDVGVRPDSDATASPDGAEGGSADMTGLGDGGAYAVDASSAADARGGTSAGDASGTLVADASVLMAVPDSGLTETGPGDAPGEAANPLVCNALANAAPAIQLTPSAGTPPASMGGPLVSGTYFLTSATAYGGSALCAAITLKETALLTSATAATGMLDVVASASVVPAQQTTHDDYTASGSTLTLQPTCPLVDGGATQVQYTAVAGRVELTLPPSTVQGCGTLVEVFTKQ